MSAQRFVSAVERERKRRTVELRVSAKTAERLIVEMKTALKGCMAIISLRQRSTWRGVAGQLSSEDAEQKQLLRWWRWVINRKEASQHGW